MSRRTERIAEVLKAEVARVLHQDVTDPRIGMITLIRVSVSPDMRRAWLFWSALDPKSEIDIPRISAGLESAAPFLRRRVAKVLPLKRTPELEFRYDPSISQGSEILSLLDSLAIEPADAETAEDSTATNRDAKSK